MKLLFNNLLATTKCKALLLVLVLGFLSRAVLAQQLVMAGDHPDPSVVKIGDAYWASATTSNWFPAFPIMKSKDLIHWEQEGYIFNRLPSWADFYFWAPEISYDKGKVYVYYAAHKRNGNLCVGVASADRPEGPYKDHGPLICQEDGSIDPFPVRDENGKLYLLWKEDANSVNKPTPIWAMEMNESRTALIGDKKELFRNSAPWEGNLVEGVSVMRHGGYFYAFYAAFGCCGIGCTYAVGVARAKNLLGPWEKYSKNPIMTNNEIWVCPGHGTPVQKDGRFYLLHHAYDKKTIPFTGRQGILSEFRFTADQWIEFIKKPAADKTVRISSIKDNFSGHKLSGRWQWSVFHNVQYKVNNNALELSPGTAGVAYIGQKIECGNYEATALLNAKASTASQGLGVIGDDKNLVAIFYNKGKISLLEVKDGKERIVIEKLIGEKREIYLKVRTSDAKNITFSYSVEGKIFIVVNEKIIDATFIPPWDRAVRVGLLSKGAMNQKAIFERFEMDDK